MTQQKFSAKLKTFPNMNATYVDLPFDVPTIFGKKRVKIKAWMDGHLYRGLLCDMGEGYFLLVNQEMRRLISKNAGDTISVVIEEDIQERIVIVPHDLQQLFKLHSQAESFYKTLSYTNRKEYVRWIESAKRDETREKRLKVTIEKLLDNKKNPTQK